MLQLNTFPLDYMNLISYINSNYENNKTFSRAVDFDKLGISGNNTFHRLSDSDWGGVMSHSQAVSHPSILGEH